VRDGTVLTSPSGAASAYPLRTIEKQTLRIRVHTYRRGMDQVDHDEAYRYQK
jgi:hypothetical protein